ncbi:MAG: hypothetical protein WKF92_09785 [Pyrinomonadaceae bacterium]
MKSIPEFLDTDCAPDGYKRRECKRVEIIDTIDANSGIPFRDFEIDVFNFLCTNRAILEIRKIYRFQNCILDGEIETSCGRNVPIEIKYRMNWTKACQAQWQFARYLVSRNHMADISTGIVFFEEFSGDWDRQSATRSRKNGWDRWYGEHQDTIPLHLLQLKDEEIQSCL